MVIWVIGLSGAGKTTFGTKLYQKIKKTYPNTVFLDGDIFRSLMSGDLGYSAQERYKNAYRQHQLCRLLDAQGIHVVCCILSNQRDIQSLNRKDFSQYFEIYIDASLEALRKRDPKGLYKAVADGKTKNVVGVDIEFNPPLKPDYVIQNDTFVDTEEMVEVVAEKLTTLNLPSSRSQLASKRQ